MRWDVPPRVKVLEAMGAIADGRVKLMNGYALVQSSLGDKEYEVRFDLSKNQIQSNDNGSTYRGYLGYPSIAVLMLTGKLPFDQDISSSLKNIPWKQLNEKFKNYHFTELEAKKKAQQKGTDPQEIDKILEHIIQTIDEISFRP